MVVADVTFLEKTYSNYSNIITWNTGNSTLTLSTGEKPGKLIVSFVLVSNDGLATVVGPITIETSEWTENLDDGSYKYIYEDINITSDTAVINVNFLNETDLYLTADIKWSTSPGILTFSTKTIPTQNIELEFTLF